MYLQWVYLLTHYTPRTVRTIGQLFHFLLGDTNGLTIAQD